jgi:hypothetical protein
MFSNMIFLNLNNFRILTFSKFQKKLNHKLVKRRRKTEKDSRKRNGKTKKVYLGRPAWGCAARGPRRPDLPIGFSILTLDNSAHLLGRIEKSNIISTAL